MGNEIGVRRSVWFVALLLAGLVAGATFGIWQGYDPRGLDPATFVSMHQGAVRGLNVLLPALGLGSIVFLGISAWLTRKDRPAPWLFLLATVCMVAAGAITRFVNQPINAEVMNWTAASLPPNWTALRETWWTWHVVRALASLAGFALALVAVLWSGGRHRAG